MKLQSFADKSAIGLSLVCVIHCLALPIFLILFPSVALTFFSDEHFHQLMLMGILPLSLIALSVGFFHHRDLSVLLISIIGLTVLVGTAVIDHELLGEFGEIALTVTGSVIIAYGHLRNSKLRKLFARQDIENNQALS